MAKESASLELVAEIMPPNQQERNWYSEQIKNEIEQTLREAASKQDAIHRLDDLFKKYKGFHFYFGKINFEIRKSGLLAAVFRMIANLPPNEKKEYEKLLSDILSEARTVQDINIHLRKLIEKIPIPKDSPIVVIDPDEENSFRVATVLVDFDPQNKANEPVEISAIVAVPVRN